MKIEFIVSWSSYERLIVILIMESLASDTNICNYMHTKQRRNVQVDMAEYGQTHLTLANCRASVMFLI